MLLNFKSPTNTDFSIIEKVTIISDLTIEEASVSDLGLEQRWVSKVVHGKG